MYHAIMHSSSAYAIEMGANIWTPSEITASLWLDAADADTITASAGAVSVWADKSGNGYDVAQGTGSRQPITGTRTINSVNAIGFDGSDDRLSGLLGQSVDDVSIFTVSKADSVNGRYMIGNAGLGSVKSRQYIYDNGIDFGNTKMNYTGSTSAQIISAYVSDIGDGSTQGIRVNGGSVTTGSVDRGITALDIYIGDYSSSITGPFNGVIGEIIIVGSVLSDTDRQKMEGYLAWKWGLAANLPATHPYKLFWPTAI
jgi:hypothetical protein